MNLVDLSRASSKVVALSRWVDEAEVNDGRDPEALTWHRTAKVAEEAEVNDGRDPEALTWHRTAKVAEEAGEVIQAMIGWTGGNPRKGLSSSIEEVEEELLDTALAALGAVEHLRGHTGQAFALLLDKIDRVHARAGAPTGARL